MSFYLSHGEKLHQNNSLNTFSAASNDTRLVIFTNTNWILTIPPRNTQSNFKSKDYIFKRPSKFHQIMKPDISPEKPKIISNSRKFKFGLKIDIYFDPGTNLDFQIRLINLIDQAINKANLKFNLLDVSMIDDSSDLDLDCVLIPFYYRLRRHGKLLEYLKLRLGSLALYSKSLSSCEFETKNGIKSPFSRLINLKGLNLNIWLIYQIGVEQSRALNQLYRSIALYMRNLRCLKLKIDSNIFDEESQFKLAPSWSCIKKLKNLESLTLELEGDDITCQKSSIISLLSILRHNPKLKKFQIYIDSKNSSIDYSPFQNLSKYFERLNTLENLSLDMPINEQYNNISSELIKIIKKYPKLKEICLVCGDKSHGFKDKVREIIECLGTLSQLQNMTIKYKFEMQNELLSLANTLNQLKSLVRLNLHIQYTGEQSDIFNDFMASLKLSQDTLKYLTILINTTKNSIISYKFWESFINLLPHNTLELLDLEIFVREIEMNNDIMEKFAHKLAGNINLSNLSLNFHARHKFNGSGLIWIPKILKCFKYLMILNLYHRNVDDLNIDYFNILQNSLKDKHVKVLNILINHENNAFVFPLSILNDIKKLLANNHIKLKEIHLVAPIYPLTLSEKRKFLKSICNSAIPKLEIKMEQFERKFAPKYDEFNVSSIPLGPKVHYSFYTKSWFIICRDNGFDDPIYTVFAENGLRFLLAIQQNQHQQNHQEQ